MADDVREVLRSFILSTFLPGEAPESLKDSTLLITSGVIASMSLLELVSFIEHAFSVTLQPDDMDALTVSTLWPISSSNGGRATS